MAVNKQIIVGNLGKDPDFRTFPDGSMACRFSVAVTEKGYTLQNGTQVPEHTEWFNILCRGKKAEVAGQYLHKGDKVYIEGATYTGEFTDQSGQKRRYTEVRCEVLELLTPKGQQPSVPQYGQAPQPISQPSAPQPAPVGVYGHTAMPQPVPQYGTAPAPQPIPQPAPMSGQPAPVGQKPWE